MYSYGPKITREEVAKEVLLKLLGDHKALREKAKECSTILSLYDLLGGEAVMYTDALFEALAENQPRMVKVDK